MRTLNTIAIICVLTISSTASDLASSFEQAAAVADAQENAPGTKDYFVGTLLPYYGETYSAILQSCFKKVAKPDNSPFSFVVALGPNGRAVRLYNDRETNIYVCLRESLQKDTFPKAAGFSILPAHRHEVQR